jgi:prophage regulatory protein
VHEGVGIRSYYLTFDFNDINNTMRHDASSNCDGVMHMTTSTYLTDVQVAERFGVNRATVWRWAKHNPGFPSPVSLSSGFNRWRLADIEAWEASKIAAQSQAA